MRQSLSQVWPASGQMQSPASPEISPETPPETPPAGRSERRPVVERIAGWSARHRKTAVFGWLALVAVLFVAGQALGSKNLPSYDPGQSGQAERALHRPRRPITARPPRRC